MKESSFEYKKSLGLWVETEEDRKLSVVMAEGMDQAYSLPPVTPAGDLITAVELDYTAYRRNIQWLYKKHPLLN